MINGKAEADLVHSTVCPSRALVFLERSFAHEKVYGRNKEKAGSMEEGQKRTWGGGKDTSSKLGKGQVGFAAEFRWGGS